MNPNAAIALEGRELDGGWLVGPLNVPNPNATGGNFSVTYPVSKADGTQGFLKVLNIAYALASPDPVTNLARITTDFLLERELCIACGERRLSRVVTALDSGEFHLPEYGLGGSVNYIIFELATRDVRIALSNAETIDNVIRLEYVHSVAVGLRQLHGISVAHQDLKPSNFLVFPNDERGRATGKLSDLGRAYRKGAQSRFDNLVVPGDSNYAPPEQLYRFVHADESARRYAADLYQLGNLASYIFVAETMNSMLTRHLDPAHHWSSYGDGYETVLPYVIDAHGAALEDLRARLPDVLAADLIPLIGYLTHPDARQRKDPAARKQKFGSPYELERTIARIDLIARREAVRIRS